MTDKMKFFVYGTLKEGGFFASRFDPFRKSVEEAKIEGVDMLDLGGFPGAVPGEGTILGEVHEYKNEEEVLRAFDRIEGFSEKDPDGSLYLRKEVEVTLKNGEKTTATMYFFNRETDWHRKVENGVWDIRR
jgi:gamma-glutamylcyclotransferase (GGCT)/AIG2-like uncharacterized protein YtfP